MANQIEDFENFVNQMPGGNDPRTNIPSPLGVPDKPQTAPPAPTQALAQPPPQQAPQPDATPTPAPPANGPALGTKENPIPSMPPTPAPNKNLDDFEKFLGNMPSSVSAGGSGDKGSLSNPIQTSPLTATDRFKMSFGNAGKFKFLTQKFGPAGVHLDPDKGVLLYQDGKWHQADPSLWGEGSFNDKVYEFAKDVADMGGAVIPGVLMEAGRQIVGGIGGKLGGIAMMAAAPEAGPFAEASGQVAGETVGGLAGMTAGAVAGGRINSVLGRVFGTYDPGPPDQQMKEMSLDAAFALVGEGVMLGARPVLGNLVKGSVGFIKKASQGVKDAFSSVLGNNSGVGKKAMQLMWSDTDMPGKLMAGVKSFVDRREGDTALAQIDATAASVNEAKTVLEDATKELPKKWKEGVDYLVNSPETASRVAKLDVDVPQLFLNAGKAAEDAGLGRFVPIEAPAATEKSSKVIRKYYGEKGLERVYETEYSTVKNQLPQGMTTTGNEVTQITDKYGNPMGGNTMQSQGIDTSKPFEGGFKFVPYTMKEIGERAKQGLPGSGILPDKAEAINGIVQHMSDLANGAGKVRGKEAANVLVEYNRQLNELVREIRSDPQKKSTALDVMADQMARGFRTEVGKEFDKVGLSKEYTHLSDIYQKFGNLVDQAYSDLGKEQGPQLLVNRLAAESGQRYREQTMIYGNQFEPGFVDLLPNGADRIKKIAELDAIRRFIPWVNPSMKLSQIGSGSVASAATLGVGLKAGIVPAVALGAPMATTFSPRLVGNMSQAFAGGIMKPASATANMAATTGAKGLAYMRQGTDFLKNLTPKQMREFIQSDDAVRAFLAPMTAAQMKEDAMTDHLLQQSGAAPNAQ